MSGRFHCPFSLSGLKELIGLEAIKCMYNAYNYPEYIHRIENLAHLGCQNKLEDM